MTLPDRISLVLKAPEGGSLEQVQPFALLGAHVSIGRVLAVIAGASLGDLQNDVEMLNEALAVDKHLALASPEMANLLKRIDVKVGGLMAVAGHGMAPSEEMWTEAEDALAEIELVLNLSQGRPAAPSHLIDGAPAEKFSGSAEKSAPPSVSAPDFDIDEHARMAADARRYRWLRDRERIEDPDEDLLVVRGDNWLSAEELDQEIDTALRLEALQQQVVLEQQP
ncbi:MULTISPECIES: hypothetical protein [Pseudomonas]|uniref:hypothetical protein n=1 Tax=Pseudomonas TaxID=286 RepID=UPI000AAC9C90|nr:MULTISPECIES: hypothetical protein [Pseudomonas]MDH0046308.1 hypothetical protein [Pseudomonas juntendi]